MGFGEDGEGREGQRPGAELVCNTDDLTFDFSQKHTYTRLFDAGKPSFQLSKLLLVSFESTCHTVVIPESMTRCTSENAMRSI